MFAASAKCREARVVFVASVVHARRALQATPHRVCAQSLFCPGAPEVTTKSHPASCAGQLLAF
eukprot:14202875-Alexandrium_andersonii.AAC.2